MEQIVARSLSTYVKFKKETVNSATEKDRMGYSAQAKQGIMNLMKSVFERKVKKARRIITYFYYPPSIRKQHLYWDERQMNEQDVDDYIEDLKNAKINEESVAHVLLKWLAIKKKYANVSADTAAELDMEAFKKHASESN